MIWQATNSAPSSTLYLTYEELRKTICSVILTSRSMLSASVGPVERHSARHAVDGLRCADTDHASTLAAGRVRLGSRRTRRPQSRRRRRCCCPAPLPGVKLGVRRRQRGLARDEHEHEAQLQQRQGYTGARAPRTAASVGRRAPRRIVVAPRRRPQKPVLAQSLRRARPRRPAGGA